MIVPCLLGLVLATADAPAPPDSRPPDATADDYRAERSKAGRDAASQVRLALWCESHGLTSERLRHLAMAAMADPSNAAARGLLGLVSDGGGWKSPEAVADRARTDASMVANLAEYNARRARASKTVADQAALAAWCERHGLDAEAQAHYTAVVRLAPDNEMAWKKLGCRKVGGRWLNDDQIAQEKAEAAAQAEADRRWRPALESIKGRLAQRRHVEEARKELAAIVDPRAVPSIWRVFVRSSRPELDAAVSALGQIDSPGSNRALAMIAVFAPEPITRRIAAEILRRRDPRDFLAILIAQLRKPIRYEVRRVGGPGSPGSLFVEGDAANVRRIYAPPALSPLGALGAMAINSGGDPVMDFAGQVYGVKHNVSLTAIPVEQYASGKVQDPKARVLYDKLGRDHPLGSLKTIPENMQDVWISNDTTDFRQDHQLVPIAAIAAEYYRVAATAELQLEQDVAAIDRANLATRVQNDAASVLLTDVTGVDQGSDPEAWRKWLIDAQGYAYLAPPEVAKPTTDVFVPINDQVRDVPSNSFTSKNGSTTAYTVTRGHSCFAAGTTVRTLLGARPIETLAAGDRILTQDATTGVMTFQPILEVFHNPPAETFKVDLGGDESIVCTGIHRLWVPNRGWVMARDLKAGDLLRTVGGVATIESIAKGASQKVFNLEVASGSSFFVGKSGVLAHDNSTIRPVEHPFDAAAEIAASTVSAAGSTTSRP